MARVLFGIILGAISIEGTNGALSAEQIAECGCTHVVPSHHHAFDGEQKGVKGGDVVCYEAGDRGAIKLANVKGTPENRVIVKNCGGVVHTTPFRYAMSVQGVSNIRLTGTGDPKHFYGFKFGGTLGVEQLSTDIEIDHVNIYRADFAGIIAKTDPKCDPATWEENFVMENVDIHHNLISDTGDGEGMYIGYTAQQRKTECEGVEMTLIPHKIRRLRVSHNVVHNTGADGIQISSTVGDAVCSHNSVSKYGQRPFARWQNSGIQIGGGKGVVVSRNTVTSGTGTGLSIFASDVVVADNVVNGAGHLGLFGDTRPSPVVPGDGGVPHHYVRNVFINCKDHAIRTYNRHTTAPVLIANNTVIVFEMDDAQASRFIKLHPLTDAVQSGNIYLASGNGLVA